MLKRDATRFVLNNRLAVVGTEGWDRLAGGSSGQGTRCFWKLAKRPHYFQNWQKKSCSSTRTKNRKL